MQPTQIQMKGDYLVYIRSGVHFFSPNLSVDPEHTQQLGIFKLGMSRHECYDVIPKTRPPTKPNLRDQLKGTLFT